MGQIQPTENLRQTLRGAPASAHDLLDGTMREAAGWTTRDDYTRFLSLQYAARLPVEAWLEANAPNDLRPPAQSALIAKDLGELDEDLPETAAQFAIPTQPNASESSDRARALGAAWVLAGSSLGNRSILGEVRRTAQDNGATDWPTAFLGDPGMLEFWKGLRKQIEVGAETETVELASQAADAVFQHFIDHAQSA